MWWIYLGVFGYWNALTLTTRILNYYLIVFEYSLNDGKKPFLCISEYCCKNDEHFQRRVEKPPAVVYLLVYLNWKILHAHGKAMECIGKYNRQIFQTRALNIDRNVFN